MNLAGVPRVLGAGGSRVGHVKDVIADHSQGSVGSGGEGHVDTDVEGVSRRGLVVLQLLLQLLIVCMDR